MDMSYVNGVYKDDQKKHYQEGKKTLELVG